MKNIDYTKCLELSPIELKVLQKKGWAMYCVGSVVYTVLRLFGGEIYLELKHHMMLGGLKDKQQRLA